MRQKCAAGVQDVFEDDGREEGVELQNVGVTAWLFLSSKLPAILH